MKGLGMLMAALSLAACSALPVIGPAPAGKMACPFAFSGESRRFVHAIEASAAGKTQAVMIGVTLLNPAARTISCAIVTPEGLSLFEATQDDGRLSVSRALPPFDSPDFARNMVEDIELIFLAPPGAPAGQGRLADGSAVCRWHRDRGGWVDVSKDMTGRVRIRRYTECGGLERTVALAADAENIYSVIDLQASGLISYTLHMTLIESESVAGETKN